jgi:colanic acid/amylovoran biosynthesis glycosyltransferase
VSSRPHAWFYRRELLPASEVFIVRQADALSRYEPVWAGNRRVAGLDLPPDRTFVAGGKGRTGRLEERWHIATRRSPRLAAGVRRCPPSLVHAHFGPDGLEALPLAKRAGVPLVVTFHGYDVSVGDRGMNARGLTHTRYARRKLDLAEAGALCIAVSSYVRDRLLDQGFPPERIVVQHLGVEIPPAPRRSEERDEKRVIFVGRFAGKKGLAELIDAMAVCQAAVPDARLTLVGDGPLRPVAEAAAERLPGVGLTGWLPPDEVLRLIDRSTVMCVPSVTAPDGDTEGLPTVAVEAASRGVPSVAFRHAGIPEIVEHDVTGLLADEGDSRALGELLARALSDEALVARLGAAARERAAESFDVRTQAARLEGLYDRELATRSR